MSLLDFFRKYDPVTANRRLPFSPRAQRVLELARDHARREGRQIPNSSDVVVGLRELGQGVAWNVLQRLQVNMEAVPAKIAASEVSSVPFTELLPMAELAMKNLQHPYLGTEHLLLSLINDKTNGLSIVLSELCVTEAILRAEIMRELDPWNSSLRQ